MSWLLDFCESYENETKRTCDIAIDRVAMKLVAILPARCACDTHHISFPKIDRNLEIQLH